MFNSIKLTSCDKQYFYRGTVFRLFAEYPYEDVVDFMLILNSESSSGFSFIVATGTKAGNIVCHLPEEALFDSSVVAISKKWIIENFIDFVYPDVINFEEIRVSSHYQI